MCIRDRLKGSPGGAAIMLMALIWVIVGIVNVAYAMRKHPQQLAAARQIPKPGRVRRLTIEATIQL